MQRVAAAVTGLAALMMFPPSALAIDPDRGAKAIERQLTAAPGAR